MQPTFSATGSSSSMKGTTRNTVSGTSRKMSALVRVSCRCSRLRVKYDHAAEFHICSFATCHDNPLVACTGRLTASAHLDKGLPLASRNTSRSEMRTSAASSLAPACRSCDQNRSETVVTVT